MINRDDKTVEWLKALEDEAYAEQPMTTSTLIHLIEMLQTVFCPHEFERRPVTGDPANANGTESVCKKCGLEESPD